MTNEMFIDRALNIAKNYKTLYVHGCFGAPMNAKNKERYKKNTSYNKQPERQAMINAASGDTFGFDCVGLIKAIFGNWNGNLNHTYGGTVVNQELNGISYGPDHIPDYSANTMFSVCKFISTDFTNVVPGEVLWTEGHIGIYAGAGFAIECTPKWDNCVQVTAVSNIGKIAGYNARKWDKHGKLPWVTFEAKAQAPELITEIKNALDKVYQNVEKLEKELYG